MLERSLPIAMLLALLMLSACPSEFGRDGRIDQAVEQDMKADPVVCPPGKHRGPRKSNCLGPGCVTCVDDAKDSGR